VVVTWTAPNSNGSPILGYRIYIRKSDLTTYQLETTSCDGSDAAIISAAQCLIPISTLRASPFSLPWGSSVFAQLVGYNSYGDSAISPAGNGAIILTVPDAPTSLAEVTTSRTATSITFNWSAGASNGGAVVIDFRVNFDQALSTYMIRASGVTSTQYTATGLTPGLTYKFTVEARNSYGYSAVSEEKSILCATLPSVPSAPASANTLSNV
jgi:hypothetical protein